MRIYLPENFDATKNIVGYKKAHREKYLWFIHTLVEWQFKIKNSFFGYVNLQSKIIEDYLGSKYYKEVIDALERSGIIEVNPSYQATQFSKSYRLTATYQGQTKSQNFLGGKADTYLKKLRKWKTAIVKTIPGDPVYLQLWKNLQELSIDAESALEFLVKNKSNYSPDELSSRYWCIDKFEIADFFFHVDIRTGRVYNNLTNIPRELRQFLRRNEEPLVQIDVSNSQPLLFSPLLRPYWDDYQKTMKPHFDSGNKYDSFAMLVGAEPDFLIEENGHAIMLSHLLHFSVPTKELPQDMELFKFLTEEGIFYETFMDYLEAEEITDLPSRNEFKIEFFKQVFYSTYSRNRVRAHRFEEWFHFWMPNVSNAISWYKREDHAHLAIKMQKVEADVIMGTCTELTELTPNPYFLTIHDAIVCEKKDGLLVQKMLLEKFEELYALTPTAKIKKLAD